MVTSRSIARGCCPVWKALDRNRFIALRLMSEGSKLKNSDARGRRKKRLAQGRKTPPGNANVGRSTPPGHTGGVRLSVWAMLDMAVVRCFQEATGNCAGGHMSDVKRSGILPLCGL